MLTTEKLREFYQNKMQESRRAQDEDKPISEREAALQTLKRYLEQSDQQKNRARIAPILYRMQAGQRLSCAEMEYLRKNDPQLYTRAVGIDREREEYRKQLERCRSKQEAREAHNGRMMGLVQRAHSVVNGSPDSGQRMEQLEEIQMRASALQNEYNDYTSTSLFKKLPDFRKGYRMGFGKETDRPQADLARKKLDRILAQARDSKQEKHPAAQVRKRQKQWRA